jgi:regulator of protease activity HflC (stomatin/prohibitin superfamily)
MFERLIDLLINFAELGKLWTVLQPFERGVVVTLGKRVRDIGPGFNFLWPLGIDEVHKINVVPTTENLSLQTLTTSDGCTIVIGMTVRWKVSDVRKILLEVEDYEGVVLDTCYGQLGAVVAESTWQELNGPSFVEHAASAMRYRAGRAGINILNINLTDLAKCRTYRMVTE